MRLDKLTTRFQQALADAQSIAVGSDNPYIEPQHLLSALLSADDGFATSLLSRAGVSINALRDALRDSIGRAGPSDTSTERAAAANPVPPRGVASGAP